MLEKFEKNIGVCFQKKEYLQQALTHRSYLNENPAFQLSHNERLEFLGDAVLELVVTEYLYHKYPKVWEGELTAYRAALVNTVSISQVAASLEVQKFLLMSKGEAKDTGRARQSILANAYEAIIGAIYLDQGYNVARDFIGRTLIPKTDEIVSKKLWRDAKSALQEVSQEKRNFTPRYEVVGEEGPDHDKVFTVGVFLGPELICKGKGPSKQEAEQDAARTALEKLSW